MTVLERLRNLEKQRHGALQEADVAFFAALMPHAAALIEIAEAASNIVEHGHMCAGRGQRCDCGMQKLWDALRKLEGRDE